MPHRSGCRNTGFGITVTAHYSNTYLDTVHITLRDTSTGMAQTIISNRIHPFFAHVTASTQPIISSEGHAYAGEIAQGYWVDAEHLQAGYLLLNADESWSEVERVEVLPVELQAFNLSVADNHTYFVAANDEAAPVWVHNVCKIWDEASLKALNDMLGDPDIYKRIATNPKLLDGWKRVADDFAEHGGGDFGAYWESALTRGNVTPEDMHDFASARNWTHPDNPNWQLYPSRNGFVTSMPGRAEAGQTFDRYIPKEKDGQPLDPRSDTGRFIADDGASYTSRALPPGTQESSQLIRYQIVQECPVTQGPAAPWFDEVGGAQQYFTGDKTLKDLIDEGYIRVIKNPKIEGFSNIFKNPKLAGYLEEAGWSDDLLKQLDDDLANPKWQKELNELLGDNPADADKIWRSLKESPGTSWELRQSDPDWKRWADREFFKEATKNGKKFEQETVLNRIKNRTTPEYANLKSKVDEVYNVNLDEYDMYSQLQLKYNADDFFVADQVYVKWGENAAGETSIVDYVVIENKLRNTTPLTKNQAAAKQVNKLEVRSITPTAESKVTDLEVDNKTILNTTSPKWIKVHDGDTGDEITGMVGI